MATQAECARWMDISERRFRELVSEGVIDKADAGQYDLQTVIHQYVRHLREVAAGRSSDADVAKRKADAEARRAVALAGKAELEEAELRRELVPVAQVAEPFAAAVMLMKTRLLSIPTKSAPQIGARDVAVAERIIRDEVHAALKELSEVEIVGAEAATV